MKLIGLGHESGVGKDELALQVARVCDRQGIPFHRVAFADAMKRFAAMMFCEYGLQQGQYYTGEGRVFRYDKLPDIGQSPVELWVAFGQAMRSIHPHIWVDQVRWSLRHMEPDAVVVVTDVRFPNEVEMIREEGGMVYKVRRNGIMPRAETSSDRVLDGFTGWDGLIENNGTIADLAHIAEGLVR